jgi:hypothetical protein
VHSMLNQSTLLAGFHAERPRVESAFKPTRWRQSFFAWAGWAVAMSAVLVFALMAIQFLGNDSNTGDRATNLRIASVENIEGIAWFDESQLARGAEISSGLVRVDSGAIDLRFDNGTLLLIEGPAELSIETGMLVSLKHGRLAARVPEEAYGFTVLGPNSAVVDLGTEFAVAVDGEQSWVEVYDGEVDVALLNDDGQAWKSRELTASGPVRIDASNGQIVDEVPPIALPRFAVVLPDSLAVPTEYVKAVLKNKPAHYWRFEEAEAGQVADVVGEAAAVIQGGSLLDNGGLYFPGKRQLEGLATHGLAFVAEPLPSLFNNEFTLEAWVNPSFAQKRGLIGINHRSPDSKSQEKLYQLQLLPAQHQTVFPGETFQFTGDLWPYGEKGIVRVFSATKYRPGAWHHVVAVRRDSQIEIYLNGEKAQTAPAPPLKSNPLPATITIGRSSSPETENRKRDGRYFKGMVDEIAVYPFAMSADEVAEHYRLMHGK